MREGQTLKDLFDERTPLYERYADLIVDTAGLSIRESAFQIRESCNQYRTIG